MAYVDPAKVVSPQASVRGVRVLYNDTLGGWSVAEVNWEGNEAVGIRWNGADGETGVGNPQSRGHPTWFILPQPLEQAVLKEVERLSKGERDQLAEGYRAMTRDRAREKQAANWSEGLIADAGDSEG
jgi:hypothetical protein